MPPELTTRERIGAALLATTALAAGAVAVEKRLEGPRVNFYSLVGPDGKKTPGIEVTPLFPGSKPEELQIGGMKVTAETATLTKEAGSKGETGVLIKGDHFTTFVTTEDKKEIRSIGLSVVDGDPDKAILKIEADIQSPHLFLVDLKTGKIMRDLLDEKTLAMLEATAREHFPKLGGKTAKFYYSIEACPVFASHREGETPVLDHINYWLIKDTDYFRQVKGTSQFEATNIAASERILVTIDSKGNRIGEAESFGRNQEVLIFQNPSTGQEFEVVTTRSGKPFAEAAAGKQELADIDPNSIPTRHVFVVARTDQGPKKIDTFSPVGSSATAVYTEGDRIYLFQKRITQDGAESEWELTLVIDCPKSGGISSGRPTDEQRSQIKPGQGGVSPQGSSESVNWYPNLR